MLHGIIRNVFDASSHARCKESYQGKPNHNNDHLEEVGKSDRPHTAEDRINQNHYSSNDHCCRDAYEALGENMDN